MRVNDPVFIPQFPKRSQREDKTGCSVLGAGWGGSAAVFLLILAAGHQRKTIEIWEVQGGCPIFMKIMWAEQVPGSCRESPGFSGRGNWTSSRSSCRFEPSCVWGGTKDKSPYGGLAMLKVQPLVYLKCRSGKLRVCVVLSNFLQIFSAVK